jgi:hypothetical protein
MVERLYVIENKMIIFVFCDMVVFASSMEYIKKRGMTERLIMIIVVL